MLLVGWLVNCRLKANFPLVGPGPIGGVPSVGVFLSRINEEMDI